MAQKFSRIKVYNELVLQIILYGSEIWALRKKKDKTIGINGDESFQKNSRAYPF